ncbi:hypothetical protein PVAP13_8KG343602 [Panicum virgatum]|uniref:Replication factor A C-terminal domain-containing protein n=1 Tax=Panicum virgatum TaxID=38727 RepID=A0A8T0PNJ6_PANVG|nr:hypothetical protein PVAP13_8KG343602 [Panicum virgatum]
MSAYSPLSSLAPRDRLKTIFVRVMRKWEFRGLNDDGPLQHIDLILADSQGNAMYAEIPSAEAGRSYIMNPGSFPEYVYNPTPFSELKNFVGDRKKIHDVLGILVEVAEPEWVPFSNQPKPNLRRNITIKDASDIEIQISLRGQKALNFTIESSESSVEHIPTAILLTGCLVKAYQHATTWWFPSCNFCNKTCKQEDGDLICYECGTTNKYTYKYKLSFIAGDGTEEAEMICFGEIGRRIIGKPVKTVMCSTKQEDLIPLDIASIKSYRLPQKTYQITSIIASYGKQRIAQKHPQNALPTLQQADTSDVGKQPGSSQVHGLPTPSKILPMHSIHLQTPEGKDPKHSADIMEDTYHK